MAEPLFTLDDLEPERPTIGIRRRVPDGPWERFKERWLPFLDVRFTVHRELYPLRLPSEFGLQLHAKLGTMQQEARELESKSADPAALARLAELLREMAGMVLDAPRAVLDSLTPEQHLQIILAFPAAVTGKTPTRVRPENPSTSDASSPASAASTAPTAG